MKPLLVALDGSPRAPGVLKMAVAQALSTGAELVLLRAVGIPRDLPFTAMALSPSDLLRVLEQRAENERTEPARGLIPTGVRWRMRVETSTAWQAICQAAQAIDASLIVI